MLPGRQNTTCFSHEEESMIYANPSSYLRILGMICIEYRFPRLGESIDAFPEDYNLPSCLMIIPVLDVQAYPFAISR